MKKNLLFSFVLCGLLGACSLWPAQKFTPPQQEIVYQAIQDGMEEDRYATLVGFINLDGTKNTLVDVGFRAGLPVYSREMQGLLFHVGRVNSVDIDPGATGGDMYFLTNQGKIKKCKIYANWFVVPTSESNIAFVHSLEYSVKLQLIDITTCSVTKTLLERRDINAASLSQSGKLVAFDAGYTFPDLTTAIYVMSIDEAIPQKIIDHGLRASISPDDSQIAFVWDDGIYISKIDGSDQIKIVPLSYTESRSEVTLFPFPQWSPDGRYLIYHKCNNSDCYRLRDFSMYKFDLETWVESKIADNGLFPTWIR